MRAWVHRAISVYEYFIAYLFFKGALNVYGAEAVISDSHLLNPLTGRLAIVTYALLFAALAIFLTAAKLLRLVMLHGYTLKAMYLVATYIVILSMMVNGWHSSMLFSIFITLSIAATYLYWRYRVLFEFEEVETDGRAVPPC